MPNKPTFLGFALLWTIVITLLSLVQVGEIGGDVKIPYKDKMVHFVFYFVFVLLWFGWFKNGRNDGRKAWRITIVALLYGLLMEAFQGWFTLNRTADPQDALANSLGAFAALLMIRFRFLNKNNA